VHPLLPDQPYEAAADKAGRDFPDTGNPCSLHWYWHWYQYPLIGRSMSPVKSLAQKTWRLPSISTTSVSLLQLNIQNQSFQNSSNYIVYPGVSGMIRRNS